MSKNKGARGERELAAKFEEIFGCKARRGRQFCGSPDSPDIQTTLPGVHPECKRVERLQLYDAMDQATADADDKIPIVCHRRNKKEWILCLKLKDAPQFAQLISDFMNRRKWEMKIKIKDLITVLQKYDPELDIHVREDWSYYKESGISHYEPCITQYARTEYNTLLTEDEGDLIPLDMLDDVIVDAVAELCRKQKIEYHSPSYDGEEPSEEQREIEKTVRDSVEYVYILG